MRPTSLIAAMLTAATLALPSVADMTTLDELKIGTPMLRAMLLTPPVGGDFLPTVETDVAGAH